MHQIIIPAAILVLVAGKLITNIVIIKIFKSKKFEKIIKSSKYYF
jgi:hypothetical protein